ncbi:MAG TPA: CapA family protein, partial [Burkholderiaceae bacterium]
MKRLLLALTCLLPFAVPAEPVSLVFAGDIVLVGQPGKLIAEGHDPFEEVADTLRADIRVANLECVVATSGEAEDKIFTFRADPHTLPLLKRHFDAVSIANNHSGDYGRPAFAEMLGLLDHAGIAHFGGGYNLSEAHAPLIVERKGLRIALLGYNEFMPRSFEADADAPGTAWSEDEQVAADIRRARGEYHADLVVPIMHWGWENERVANSRQRQLAHLMIDAGADAVIGGHPHVTQ